MRKSTKIMDISFIYTLFIFGVGMIHISFTLIGLVCYISPLVLYIKYCNKLWCQTYCPRASFLTVILQRFSLKLKIPPWLTSKRVKSFFVYYVVLNLMFALMSTTAVAFNIIAPMNYIRLFMAFEAPFTLIQLIELNLPSFIIHFSYRVYSMILSTTLIGLVLGFLYIPRAWCMICPVNTLSIPKKMTP
jgi:hypothetical protein